MEEDNEYCCNIRIGSSEYLEDELKSGNFRETWVYLGDGAWGPRSKLEGC